MSWGCAGVHKDDEGDDQLQATAPDGQAVGGSKLSDTNPYRVVFYKLFHTHSPQNIINRKNTTNKKYDFLRGRGSEK